MLDANITDLSLCPRTLARVLNRMLLIPVTADTRRIGRLPRHCISVAAAFVKWPALRTASSNGPLPPWLVHALVQEAAVHDHLATLSHSSSSNPDVRALMHMLASLQWLPMPSSPPQPRAFSFAGGFGIYPSPRQAPTVSTPLEQAFGLPASADWAVLSALCECVMVGGMPMQEVLPQLQQRHDAIMHAPLPAGAVVLVAKTQQGLSLQYSRPANASRSHLMQSPIPYAEKQQAQQVMRAQLAAASELRGLGLWAAYESARLLREHEPSESMDTAGNAQASQAVAATHGEINARSSDAQSATAHLSEKVQYARHVAMWAATRLSKHKEHASFTAAAWEVTCVVALQQIQVAEGCADRASAAAALSAGVNALEVVGMAADAHATRLWANRNDPTLASSAATNTIATDTAAQLTPCSADGAAAAPVGGAEPAAAGSAEPAHIVRFNAGLSHCPAVLEAFVHAAHKCCVWDRAEVRTPLTALGVHLDSIPSGAAAAFAPVHDPRVYEHALLRPNDPGRPDSTRMTAGCDFVRPMQAASLGEVDQALSLCTEGWRLISQDVESHAAHLEGWQHVLASQGWLVHVNSEGRNIMHGSVAPDPPVFASMRPSLDAELALTRGPVPDRAGHALTQRPHQQADADPDAHSRQEGLSASSGLLALLCHEFYGAVLKAELRPADKAAWPAWQGPAQICRSNLSAMPQLMAAFNCDVNLADLCSFASKEGAAAVGMQLLGLERSTCVKLFSTFFSRPAVKGSGFRSAVGECLSFYLMYEAALKTTAWDQKAVLPTELVKYAFVMLHVVAVSG